jgi:hypothetical protein
MESTDRLCPYVCAPWAKRSGASDVREVFFRHCIRDAVSEALAGTFERGEVSRGAVAEDKLQYLQVTQTIISEVVVDLAHLEGTLCLYQPREGGQGSGHSRGTAHKEPDSHRQGIQ